MVRSWASPDADVAFCEFGSQSAAEPLVVLFGSRAISHFFCNATALRTVLETEEGKLGFRCLTGKPRLGNSRELLAQRARIRMDPQKGIWDPIWVGIGEFT